MAWPRSTPARSTKESNRTPEQGLCDPAFFSIHKGIILAIASTCAPSEALKGGVVATTSFAIGCRSPFQERLLACQAKSQRTPSRLLHNRIYVTQCSCHLEGCISIGWKGVEHSGWSTESASPAGIVYRVIGLGDLKWSRWTTVEQVIARFASCSKIRTPRAGAGHLGSVLTDVFVHVHRRARWVRRLPVLPTINTRLIEAHPDEGIFLFRYRWATAIRRLAAQRRVSVFVVAKQWSGSRCSRPPVGITLEILKLPVIPPARICASSRNRIERMDGVSRSFVLVEVQDVPPQAHLRPSGIASLRPG
jgi:hypothetical protein